MEGDDVEHSETQNIESSVTVGKSASVLDIVLICLLFFLAGVAEIGGGWGVWQWRKEDKSVGYMIVGCLALVGYGFLPTFQPDVAGAFYRVYAAYGCWFIFLSLVWGYAIDGNKPDAGDLVGAGISVLSAICITFWPWR